MLNYKAESSNSITLTKENCAIGELYPVEIAIILKIIYPKLAPTISIFSQSAVIWCHTQALLMCKV